MRKPSIKRKLPSFKFVRDIVAELKKVIWPTRKETRRLTTLVLIVCLAAGIILGVVDYGFTRLVQVFFGGG